MKFFDENMLVEQEGRYKQERKEEFEKSLKALLPEFKVSVDIDLNGKLKHEDDKGSYEFKRPYGIYDLEGLNIWANQLRNTIEKQMKLKEIRK